MTVVVVEAPHVESLEIRMTGARQRDTGNETIPIIVVSAGGGGRYGAGPDDQPHTRDRLRLVGKVETERSTAREGD